MWCGYYRIILFNCVCGVFIDKVAFCDDVTYVVFFNKFREIIAVKVLHTSLLNTTVVAFKVLPLGSYAPMHVMRSFMVGTSQQAVFGLSNQGD